MFCKKCSKIAFFRDTEIDFVPKNLVKSMVLRLSLSGLMENSVERGESSASSTTSISNEVYKYGVATISPPIGFICGCT